MRFNLRLHGRTDDGKPCQVDISVYANGHKQLEAEVMEAAKNAAWRALGQGDWVPEGARITVESVESLDRDKPKRKKK